MSRKAIIFAGVIAVMTLLLYGLLRPPRVVRSQAAGVGDDSVRTPAPDFELRSFDGRTVKLSDFRGKVVVLNFWATYCTPCRVEVPWLMDFYRRYKEQGLEVIGVAMDDGGRKQVAAFVKEMKVNYTILMGNRSLGDAYGGMRFLPQTVFISRAGKIINRTLGIKSKSDFEDAVKQSLSTQTP
jgi:peroxiredoxin